MNEFLEKVFGSDKPYQRMAYKCAQYLKMYAEIISTENTAIDSFKEWCVVDIDDMIIDIKTDMDELEAEWREDCAEHIRSEKDKAHFASLYIKKWFILKELEQVKEENGFFKYCVDMITQPDEIEDK